MTYAGNTVNLTGHTHQVEQTLLNVMHQCNNPLDYLTGQILVILCDQNIVEIARHIGAGSLDLVQKVIHALVQLTKLISGHFAALQPLPISTQ